MIYIFSIIMFLVSLRLFFSNKHFGFVLLVSFGVLYYIISPFLMFKSGFVDGFPGIEEWSLIFSKSIIEYEILIYYSVVLLFFIMIFSSYLNRVKLVNFTITKISPTTVFLSIVFIAILLFSVWIKARGMFFKGYATDYNATLMGQMATFNLLINFVCLYCFISGHKRLLVFGLFFLVGNSILLLGMGGRMYVVTVIIAWFLLICNRSSGKKRVKYFFYFVSFAFIFSAIGIWRLGILDYSFLPYMFFAEPIFTSYSSSSFLFNNEIPIFGDFSLYLKSFVGVLPSFFFPDKTSFYTTPQDLGYDFIAPLGATSIVVYSLVCFGILGTFFYILFLTLFFTWLKRLNRNEDLWSAIYYSTLSVIPFLLFRESFYISIRVFILLGFVFPCILFCVDMLLKVYKNDRVF